MRTEYSDFHDVPKYCSYFNRMKPTYSRNKINKYMFVIPFPLDFHSHGNLSFQMEKTFSDTACFRGFDLLVPILLLSSAGCVHARLIISSRDP